VTDSTLDTHTADLDAPSESTSSPGPLPGEEQRYAVDESLGEGGMGLVVKAKDLRLQRQVAMKILSRPNPSARKRFIQEAQISSQLDHPGILPVYDLGEDESGSPFFTMKCLPQHDTLADVIDKLRLGNVEAQLVYTFEQRVLIVQQVCRALQYAHERGVMHRDVKPANIVLGGFGEVYLLDWGVAKLGEPEHDPPDAAAFVSASAPTNTSAGAIVGTPAYMAPEQVMEGKADPISDVYSLCAVLYELLTLRYYLDPLPEVLVDVILAVVKSVPVEAERFFDPTLGRVPRALSRICRQGLEKRRELRFQSARELEEALQLWLEGRSPIVCSGTCLQRVLARWSYHVDQHPFLVPVVSLLLAVLFVRWVVVSLWRIGEVVLAFW